MPLPSRRDRRCSIQCRRASCRRDATARGAALYAPYRQPAAPGGRALAARANALTGPFAVECDLASKALAFLRFPTMLQNIRLLCCRSSFGRRTSHGNSFARPRKLTGSARALPLRSTVQALGVGPSKASASHDCSRRVTCAAARMSIRASARIGESHRIAIVRSLPDEAAPDAGRPGQQTGELH